MKLNKSKKDKDLYYYFNVKNEKLWCYRYRYYDALGKRKEKSKQGFKTENEAYRALLEVKTDILNGEVKRVENSNLTVSEWLDIWYETHKNDWKISTRRQRESAIRLQIKPLLGKYKLEKLEKTTYKRDFINELLKKYKPTTVHLIHRIFKIAINSAVDDEIIPRNRFNKITIELNRKNDNFFTALELKKFLVNCEKLLTTTNYTLILLLAHTGLRKGEALGLQWKDINFDKRTLTVERTRDHKGVRTPKTKNSYRTILIDEAFIKQLETYRTWCKQTMLSFGRHLKDDAFVFISYQKGTPISESLLEHTMNKIVQRTRCKRITPHGLRHTHATILISQRIPVKVISDRLGNTPQMILDIYGHSFKDLEEESVQAFENALNM
ncbi:tyrosine-type recombinase/integrase [Cytobacillus horneckiae]|uniref:Site-specific integrase n=1 Tax=Cytobacillus horneckiae TaxID=549687 RepID=A0A2N0ZB96_9BACI|nr:site-specific integrase [Cytobacillus horneckiae]MEC1155504.1 site-specific integrase [Cytobacillus horneckiae]MED2936823.1 site-specific integrase [Cytobacillus horneckiae]PKG26755.1 site-specific integrase [Cytobacillus horneckiae]